MGGANLRPVHFSAKMYAKTKEMDPVGGRASGAPPGSANVFCTLFSIVVRDDMERHEKTSFIFCVHADKACVVTQQESQRARGTAVSVKD